MATTMQKAVIKIDSSAVDNIDRKITAVKIELMALVRELSRQKTGRPGPQPGVMKVRRAMHLMEQALGAIREAEPAIRRAIG